MAHSREVRLPFLNHELVEFLFTLPATMKINDGWTKWIMRETFTILPPEIGWRKDKIGYEPPQKNWMESEEVKRKLIESKIKLIESKIINAQNYGISTNEADINPFSWNLLMTANLV